MKLPWNAFISALLIIAIMAMIGVTLKTALGAEPGYCKLFSREFVRIAMAHNRALLEEDDLPDQERKSAEWAVSPDTQQHLLEKNYHWCLNQDDPPSLPDTPHASDEAFIEFILQEPSSVDAVETAVAVGLKKVKEAWCRQEYRTYDPEDGTVIRSGSGGQRVGCPFEELVLGE